VLFEAVRSGHSSIARLNASAVPLLPDSERSAIRAREPQRLRRVPAMIPYGTFRAVRENNQSVFILIGLMGKNWWTFIASLIRGLVFAQELVSILEVGSW